MTDLPERTVSPGFIDNDVFLPMDAANIALQTLQSSKAKALKRLSLAREYMNYGLTTLRDLGSVDPEWPTIGRERHALSGLVIDRLAQAGYRLNFVNNLGE